MAPSLPVALCLALAASARAFNATDGLMMAYLEQAAYCSQERFESWDVGDAIPHGPAVDRSRLRLVHDKTMDATAGVGAMRQPEGCFVAIKGTTGKIDSLLDALFYQVSFNRSSCSGCEVEHGFLLYYQSIQAPVFQALRDFGCQELPLYLVGHSLGAASLNYLLYDALDAGYKVKRMYALEAPRPGNPAFAAALQEKVNRSGVDAKRIAHYQDIVVHLPPKVLYFEHALDEIYFPARSGTAYRECGAEEADCSNRWMPWRLTGRDHCWYSDINPCGCHNDTHTPPTPALFPEHMFL